MTLTIKLMPYSNSFIPHCIQVHNVYNKLETHNSPVLDQVASILSRGPTDTLPRNSSINNLIAGDFNIHHPSWGGHIIRLDIREFRLLELINKFNLSQHLPPGTATYIRSIGSKSTLDLVFTSTGNQILKIALPLLLPYMLWLFNSSLHLGYYPRHFRNSITISLRKPGKPDYHIPKAYRPIALLNTLEKTLDSIIATRLSWAAETFELLPRGHRGSGRAKRDLAGTCITYATGINSRSVGQKRDRNAAPSRFDWSI